MANDFRDRAEIEAFELPGDIQAMFASYRDAMPDPEAGANFMPQLWSRIESQRNPSFVFGRWAKGFVSVAVASCLAMSLLFFTSPAPVSPVYAGTYLDALSAAQADDASDVDVTRPFEAL